MKKPISNVRSGIGYHVTVMNQGRRVYLTNQAGDVSTSVVKAHLFLAANVREARKYAKSWEGVGYFMDAEARNPHDGSAL